MTLLGSVMQLGNLLGSGFPVFFEQ